MTRIQEARDRVARFFPKVGERAVDAIVELIDAKLSESAAGRRAPEREAEPGGGECHGEPSESLTWQWCPECGAFSEEGEPWRKPLLWASLLGRAARFESEWAGEKVLRQKAEAELAAAKGRIGELEARFSVAASSDPSTQ